MIKQKHFIDIQHIREEDTEFREKNTGAFEVNDYIQISEKIDNANACISYDPEENVLVAFSRRRTLSFDQTLNGFWEYAHNLDVDKWKEDAGLYVFGEWSGARNKIVYNESQKRKWYVYDIFDANAGKYMDQCFVKNFCAKHDLEYVHVLYEGPFISWEHCKSFMNMPGYGDCQEGIVIKNITKLVDVENRNPAYLKIVNDSFKETMNVQKQKPSEDELKEKERIMDLAKTIVTRNRVEKEIFKLRDEGIIPDKLIPENMKLIAKVLPKRIYDDCVKEENEIVVACGETFGKACGSITMKIARDIICS